jgi:CRISPR-associated endonuclease/helicase Cas3
MRRFETLVRMVFSALVDADFLDTEAFLEADLRAAGRPAQRRVWRPIAAYRLAIDQYLECFDATPPNPVNLARKKVLQWCREAATGGRGVYSLTVPTGGGKTLSSMAFALRHAEAHSLDRVIVALPFLSILDQSADVFRRVFLDRIGERSLVEHHSSIVPERDTIANRLASENWDAPLVVTTQVQLFESLFSNRPRYCRKLHTLLIA